MRVSHWVRQSHRWISVVFTACFVANLVCLFGLGMEQPPMWVTMSPLLPLMWLLGSGLYLLVLPFVGRGARSRSTSR